MRVIQVGTFPGSIFGALQLGIDQGFFADHGLELEMTSMAGGAAQIPALTTGSLDIGIGNPVSVLTAVAQGLDLKIISNFAYDGPEKADTQVIVSYPDSGIKSALDLEGKTVATNSLGGSGEAAIREDVEQQGGDPSLVTFVELPFPDMAAQLEAGAIDAAAMVQPFMMPVLEAGAEVSVEFQKDIGIGQISVLTFTTAEYAAAHPDVIADFRAALSEALTYAEAHQKDAHATLIDLLGMDPAVAQALPDEGYSAELSRDALETWAALALKYGLIAKTVDIDAIILD